jgi:ubiquitin-like-conjugating enzyme ATG3
VHPCKHASVMKKVIERMNSSVVAQQLTQQSSNGSGAASAANAPKKGSKWLFRRASGKDVAPQSSGADEEAEGMRVDFYLVVFLKFIASIVPTIEVDSTTAL